MLDVKLVLALRFLCVSPLTVWDLARCEDRKCKMKCMRGAAKLEASSSPSFLVAAGRELQCSALLLFMEAECRIFWF